MDLHPQTESPFKFYSHTQQPLPIDFEHSAVWEAFEFVSRKVLSDERFMPTRRGEIEAVMVHRTPTHTLCGNINTIDKLSLAIYFLPLEHIVNRKEYKRVKGLRYLYFECVHRKL